MALMWLDDAAARPIARPSRLWRAVQFAGEVLVLASVFLLLFYVLPLLVVR